MEERSTRAKGSATDALLWLKRALSFIHVFLSTLLERRQDVKVHLAVEFLSGESTEQGWRRELHASIWSCVQGCANPVFEWHMPPWKHLPPSTPCFQGCASTAYEETLRKHHNFLVRGIFYVRRSVMFSGVMQVFIYVTRFAGRVPIYVYTQ